MLRLRLFSRLIRNSMGCKPLCVAHSHSETVPKAKFDLRNYPDPNWTDIHKPGHMSIEWSYRDTTNKSSKKEKLIAEIIMAAMWYWILWHVYFDTEHLTGHFDHPDPSKWTNEELGILPDDVD